MKSLILATSLLLTGCGSVSPIVAVGTLVEISTESVSRCNATILKIVNKESSSSETVIYHAADSHEKSMVKFKKYLGKKVRVEALRNSGIVGTCAMRVLTIEEIQ